MIMNSTVGAGINQHYMSSPGGTFRLGYLAQQTVERSVLRGKDDIYALICDLFAQHLWPICWHPAAYELHTVVMNVSALNYNTITFIDTHGRDEVVILSSLGVDYCRGLKRKLAPLASPLEGILDPVGLYKKPWDTGFMFQLSHLVGFFNKHISLAVTVNMLCT